MRRYWPSDVNGKRSRSVLGWPVPLDQVECRRALICPDLVAAAVLGGVQRTIGALDQGPESVQGLGLGLTVVKYIVEAHGGQIQLASEAGKGSTFSFSIPINLL